MRSAEVIRHVWARLVFDGTYWISDFPKVKRVNVSRKESLLDLTLSVRSKS
jgi:hypothetical protein